MEHKQIMNRMLLFVICIEIIGALIIPTYANENIQAEYKSKNNIKITIPKDESGETIILKVEDFVTEFTKANYLYPGLLETGELDIINDSKYKYEITDVTFYGEAKGFQRTLNDMCFELGLSENYYQTGTLNISDEVWFSNNKSYYNLESSIDYKVLREMFGVNTKTDETKKYKTNKTVGQETHSKMIDYANTLLWNKGIRISLDTKSHPLELFEEGSSAQDFFDKEPSKKVLENVLGKEVRSQEKEKFYLGYKIDEEYFVNTFQGSQIALDFEIEMERIVNEVTDTENPGGETENPSGEKEPDGTKNPIELEELGETEPTDVLGDGTNFFEKDGKVFHKQTILSLGDNARQSAYIIFLIMSASAMMYNKSKLNRK